MILDEKARLQRPGCVEITADQPFGPSSRRRNLILRKIDADDIAIRQQFEQVFLRRSQFSERSPPRESDFDNKRRVVSGRNGRLRLV